MRNSLKFVWKKIRKDTKENLKSLTLICIIFTLMSEIFNNLFKKCIYYIAYIKHIMHFNIVFKIIWINLKLFQ